FPQIVRILCKIGVIALLALLPSKFLAAKDDFIPLPNILHGYLIDAMTGKGISDARIRVITQDGVDVTDGDWFVDSQGFYIVKTRERVKRTAKIVVSVPGCEIQDELKLRRIDQVASDNDVPVFRHVAICGEHK